VRNDIQHVTYKKRAYRETWDDRDTPRDRNRLKGGSAVARNDVVVKLDAEIVRKAKHVVINRRTKTKGLTLAAYLSELLAPLVDRDYKAEFEHTERGRKRQSPGGAD
jgi:hypothetical protein